MQGIIITVFTVLYWFFWLTPVSAMVDDPLHFGALALLPWLVLFFVAIVFNKITR